MRYLTRTILFVSFISLFTDIASEMLYPVMPIYLESIGFSVALIGLLEGIAEATAGISKGYFGKLSDRVGQRVPFIKWGYAMSAVSKPLMAAFTLPLWIFGARFMDRLGKGVRTASRDALLSDESTPENKGKVFGFHRGMDTLGAAIGPLMALLFLAALPGHYRLLFVLAFIPGVVAVGLTFLVKESKSTVKPKQSTSGKNFFSFLSYWKVASPSFKTLIPILLLFTLFNSSDVFLLLKIKQAGLSDLYMIGIYIFYNLIYALAAWPMGILADRLGMKRVLVFGLLLFAGAYLGIPFAGKLWQFGVLFGVYALYAASTEGVSKAWITNLCRKEDSATAIGFFTALSSVAMLLASITAGIIWEKVSPGAVFAISGTVAALCAILLVAFGHKMRPNIKTQS
ncbi:MAG TPA: MFS transporter [Williamwhitmania sp.]|nr:MFS transporter [Williamwhitmania sp.]